jgi:NADH-quinone oxidoreductase subunit K
VDGTAAQNRHHATAASITPETLHTGQIFTFFIIAAEAAEVAVGLAIVLSLFRVRRTVRTDEADLLKN